MSLGPGGLTETKVGERENSGSGSLVTWLVTGPVGLTHVDLKIWVVTIWKLRVMFCSVGIFRTSSLGDSMLSNPWERLGGVGMSDYIEICNKGQIVWISKIFLWIKENQVSQVREFSAFLYMGRCKSLGSLKSLLSYASQLSEATCLCFHLPSSSGLSVSSGCSLIPAISHRCSFPSWVLWRAGIADDCDILVYWHNRKYSIFQSFPLVRN